MHVGGWRSVVIPPCFFSATSCALIILASLEACSAPRKPGPAEPVSLQIVTPSGTTFAATLHSAPHQPAPTCVLMTMPGSTRAAWDPFVNRAQRQGYASLVMDVAALDGAGTPPKSDLRDYTDTDWAEVLEGLRAAKTTALEHGGDPENLIVGGAGMTANLALLYAHDDADILATILLSPGLEYSGIAIEETMGVFGNRPVFIAVAEGDANAHSSSVQLKAMAHGFCEMQVYDGAAHGTDLFGASTNVVEQILRWLESIKIRTSA